jgi:hypothetical protein
LKKYGHIRAEFVSPSVGSNSSESHGEEAKGNFPADKLERQFLNEIIFLTYSSHCQSKIKLIAKRNLLEGVIEYFLGLKHKFSCYS